MTKIGILLTNTGTPDAATTRAVRRYLREFLSDKRIIKIPFAIWLPILYGLILTMRPRKSAKLYRHIWTDEGSPMRSKMHLLAQKLEQRLHHKKNSNEKFFVEIGMNYGSPSIKIALTKLYQHKIDQLIVLPLYPQYSNTSTASSFDRVIHTLRKKHVLPHIRFLRSYAHHQHYIQALAASLNKVDYETDRHLLISFHGIPERFAKAGDPYQQECEATAHALATHLGLNAAQWTLCYQSQFGYDKWLKPSTQVLFDTLPKRGIKHLDVICPGFSVDCLETLEEIAISGHEQFLRAGGKSLRYVPALNDSPHQIELLTQLILEA